MMYLRTNLVHLYRKLAQFNSLYHSRICHRLRISALPEEILIRIVKQPVLFSKVLYQLGVQRCLDCLLDDSG